MNDTTLVNNRDLFIAFRRDSTLNALKCKEIGALLMVYLEDRKSSTEIF